MNVEHLCMGCMSDKADKETCPHCGYRADTLQDSPQHLPPKTILNGRYLLGKVLGYGGFGVTYLAWDLNLNVKLYRIWQKSPVDLVLPQFDGYFQSLAEKDRCFLKLTSRTRIFLYSGAFCSRLKREIRGKD
ncbi:MAG: hypothetical protein ACYDEJ_02835 [Desulfitobacteriaceae bacterium]